MALNSASETSLDSGDEPLVPPSLAFHVFNLLGQGAADQQSVLDVPTCRLVCKEWRQMADMVAVRRARPLDGNGLLRLLRFGRCLQQLDLSRAFTVSGSAIAEQLPPLLAGCACLKALTLTGQSAPLAWDGPDVAYAALAAVAGSLSSATLTHLHLMAPTDASRDGAQPAFALPQASALRSLSSLKRDGRCGHGSIRPLIAHIISSTNLTELALDNCSAVDDDALAALHVLPHLAALQLQGCRHFGDAGAAAIAALRMQLTRLVLVASGETVTDAGLACFARLTRLAHWCHARSCCQATISGLTRVVRALAGSLQSMCLPNCCDADVALMEAVGTLQLLRQLSLCVLPRAAVPGLVHLSALGGTLTALDVSWASRVGGEMDAVLPVLSRLVELNLSYCSRMAPWDALSMLTNLRTVSLVCCGHRAVSEDRINPLGLACLLPQQPGVPHTLTSLKVSANHLDAGAWQALAQFTALRQLALFKGGTSNQADLGWAGFAASLQHLTALEASSSVLSQVQLAALGQLPRLHTLVLRSCQLRRDGRLQQQEDRQQQQQQQQQDGQQGNGQQQEAGQQQQLRTPPNVLQSLHVPSLHRIDFRGTATPAEPLHALLQAHPALKEVWVYPAPPQQQQQHWASGAGAARHTDGWMATAGSTCRMLVVQVTAESMVEWGGAFAALERHPA